MEPPQIRPRLALHTVLDSCCHRHQYVKNSEIPSLLKMRAKALGAWLPVFAHLLLQYARRESGLNKGTFSKLLLTFVMELSLLSWFFGT